MRAFLALPLPEEVTDALEDIQAALPMGRLVPPENMHLTLAFLGEVPEETVEAVHEALLMLRAPGFALALAGLGTFGGDRPASLHIAAVPDAALLDLQRKIRGRLHGAGLMLARSRFVPHVTLARFRRGLPPDAHGRLAGFLAAHADLRLAPVRVAGFSLFRSTLRAQGAEHEELAQYPLGEGGVGHA